MIGRRTAGAWLITAWFCGCDATRYVVVTVEDPEELALAAATLHYGPALDRLGTMALKGARMPVTLAVTSKSDDELPLWVEVRDAAARTLGRGRPADGGMVRFRASRTGTATVQLRRPCDGDTACDDGEFCNGREVCVASMCQAGAKPCASPHACAAVTCNESTRSCDDSLTHTACGAGEACNALIGCQPCTVLPDSSYCRAEERCERDPASPHSGECVTRVGSWCEPDGCYPCDDELRCGPDCAPCGGDTPLCGGKDVGCVVDPAADPASGGCRDMADFTRCQVSTVPNRSYDICVGGVCVSPGAASYSDGVDRTQVPCWYDAAVGQWSCNAPNLGYARGHVEVGWLMPDTHQSVCYGETASLDACPAPGSDFYGQDAQYGRDALPDAAPRFVRSFDVSDEPVVSDTVTGLVWQGCPAGLRGVACDEDFPGSISWPEAQVLCDRSSWGGYEDWRLPEISELASLVDLSTSMPAIDVSSFPGTTSGPFWSASAAPNSIYGAMALEGDGRAFYHARGLEKQVRCVRELSRAVAPVQGRFSRIDGGEPIVSDATTGLDWQGCIAGRRGAACDVLDPATPASTVVWSAALAHCEGSTWGGRSDWRLPSLLELGTIFDRHRFDPALAPAVFPNAPIVQLWTSSTRFGSRERSFIVSTSDGSAAYLIKTSTSAVWCVRDRR